jgi:restriction system protein
MAVPDYQTLMRPVLSIADDGRDHTAASIRQAVIAQFQLTSDDVEERLPSGRGTTLRNRVGWALTYLFQAGLLDRPRRSVYRINDRGRAVLAEHPDRVDKSVLESFEEFREFRSRNTQTPGAQPSAATPTTPPVAADSATPEERAASAYREVRAALASDVLDRISEQSADFFEQVVLDVLQAMGYGGSRDDAAERLGRTGDEGIDGVIREDKLGLDLIYVQAKRWTNTVGRPDIQRFVGALHGQRATKGVFITTSTYSREAAAYAESVTPRVILVDGPELAELMIDHDVGVTDVTRYEIKRIDLGYFGVEEDGDTGQLTISASSEPRRA